MELYVCNLSYGVGDDELIKTFSQFGKVAKASVVVDRENGRSRGFGFVTMPDDNEARKAIEALNGNELDGRPLKLSEARPRGDRPPGKGPSRNGGTDNRQQTRPRSSFPSTGNQNKSAPSYADSRTKPYSPPTVEGFDDDDFDNFGNVPLSDETVDLDKQSETRRRKKAKKNKKNTTSKYEDGISAKSKTAKKQKKRFTYEDEDDDVSDYRIR